MKYKSIAPIMEILLKRVAVNRSIHEFLSQILATKITKNTK